MSDPRYEVDNEDIKKLLIEKAKALFSNMPEGWGFTLLLFSFGPGGDLFYFSSAQRDDMIRLMKEFIQKQQRN